MVIVRDLKLVEDIVDSSNFILGNENAELINSKVEFYGHNNYLVLKDGVKIVNSKISFYGSNSVVFLEENRHNYLLNVSIYNNSVLYMGRDNYMNGILNLVLSEEKHIFIGEDNLISFGVWMRNADPHLIYSADTGRRINPTKSIFIGDHVWIGQSAMILKGSEIHSGSIIGAMSLVAGKEIYSNESWGENPCKKIKGNVYWDGACVHKWTKEETIRCSSIEPKPYKVDSSNITFKEVENNITGNSVNDKVAYLNTISDNRSYNRFSKLQIEQQFKHISLLKKRFKIVFR